MKTFRQYEVNECLANPFQNMETARKEAMRYFDLSKGEEKYLLETRSECGCYEICTIMDGAQEDGFRFDVEEVER